MRKHTMITSAAILALVTVGLARETWKTAARARCAQRARRPDRAASSSTSSAN